MLSPQYKRKVDELWDMFWTSGMTNPLVAIEQITYLLFLKQLEYLDARREKKGQTSIYGVRPDCRLPHPGKHPEKCDGHEFCKWSKIRAMEPGEVHERLSKYVFPWLRELDLTLVLATNNASTVEMKGRPRMLEDAHFQLPPGKTITLTDALDIVDYLFPNMAIQSANTDLMGEIFEHLLGQINTSGMNGQFRTPRHIIRFMVELLNPKAGERIADPAAGTGGFLFTSIQHLLKEATPKTQLRLEWDGTPHRLKHHVPKLEKYLSGYYFTGYDNDRTMVRIAWMNLILHGVENPRIELRDSLGQSLVEQDTYDVVFANPPFTGNVDMGDLNKARVPPKSPKSKDPITDKSELLFLWLILDLLKYKGRAAVIVPEGVLFGADNAHRELRRQLLFEHDLQAVISLPSGVFQPYTGVKTSILVFRKYGNKLAPGDNPCTNNVWFYEVQADGYTLDVKHNPNYGPNDLWDALAKYPDRVVDSQDYFNPNIYIERWRAVEEKSVAVFPSLAKKKDQILGIHELFVEIPSNPDEAAAQITSEQRLKIAALYDRYLQNCLSAIAATARKKKTDSEQKSAARKQVQKCFADLNRLLNDSYRDKKLLDNEFDKYGRIAFRPVWEGVQQRAAESLDGWATQALGKLPSKKTKAVNWQVEVEEIVREFAKLDGFNIQLRSTEVSSTPNPYKDSRSWYAPVRALARDDEWRNDGNTVKGTHDVDGNVRVEYLVYLKTKSAFEANGMLKAEFRHLLDPDCIEANGNNLSAGRYKPYTLQTKDYASPSVLIQKLHERELVILKGLEQLLALVEGRE